MFDCGNKLILKIYILRWKENFPPYFIKSASLQHDRIMFNIP